MGSKNDPPGLTDEQCEHEKVSAEINLDWAAALERLNEKLEQYTALIGKPSVNPYFAIEHVIGPLKERYLKGERTQELYDEIMALE